jgi:hypothetical protein
VRTRPAWVALSSFLVATAACTPGKKETATARSGEPRPAPSAAAGLPAETSSSPPVASALGPSPPTLPSPSVSLEVSIYQSRGGGALEKVPADRTFRSGDRIRFGVLASNDGRLVLVHKGSSGAMGAIYPDKRIVGGSNTIRGGAQIVIPQKGWFVFDDKPGTETVYAVFTVGDDALLEEVQDAAYASGRSSRTPDERLASELDARARGAGGATPGTGGASIVRTIVLKHE